MRRVFFDDRSQKLFVVVVVVVATSIITNTIKFFVYNIKFLAYN